MHQYIFPLDTKIAILPVLVPLLFIGLFFLAKYWVLFRSKIVKIIIAIITIAYIWIVLSFLNYLY